VERAGDASLHSSLRPFIRRRVLVKGEPTRIVDLSREDAILHLGMVLDDLERLRDALSEINDEFYTVLI